MPGKEWKLIKTHYDAHHHQAPAAVAAAPNPYSLLKILLRYDHEKKMWLAIGPAQRDAEKAAKAKELELPKAKEQEAVVVLVNGFKEATKDHHHQVPAVINESSSSSSDYSSSPFSFESKLNATKRKLHDSYQQLANAKKQRKIQVIDPRDLPPTQPSSRGAAARSKAEDDDHNKQEDNEQQQQLVRWKRTIQTYKSTNFYFLKESDTRADFSLRSLIRDAAF